jgi:hypothetical protein
MHDSRFKNGLLAREIFNVFSVLMQVQDRLQNKSKTQILQPHC